MQKNAGRKTRNVALKGKEDVKLNSITKVCKVCEKEKDALSEFHKQKGGKYGVRSLCKVCACNSRRAHYDANSDLYKTEPYRVKQRKIYKNYYQRHRERLVERSHTEHRRKINLKATRKYAVEHSERIRKSSRERGGGYRKDLANNYVRLLIRVSTGVENSRITPEMVKLKRDQVTIRREVTKARRVLYGVNQTGNRRVKRSAKKVQQ